MKKQIVFFFIFLIMSNMMILAQNCNINAGANTVICGTSANLSGSPGGSTLGNPLWTLVSKPAGSPDPTIVTPSGYNTNVTGMTFPGNYVFQISQNCTTGTATSQVTIAAPGAVSTFTAGPDITNVNATTGAVTLNGVVPNGYTASWSAYNIYRWERSSIKTNQNSQFSSTTSATTTFSLIKKADHDIDPAYVVTLRITSTINPNCWYEDTAIVRFIPNPQILPNVSTSKCLSSSGSHFISLQNTSPKFSQGYPSTPGSSGNFGTAITMNVTSQPAGGNIAYSNIYDDNIYFTGVNVVGTYKFTLTVINASGTYTTPEITYTYNGIQSNPVNFLISSRPEQMMIYQAGSSGGEVQCALEGQITPITFYYTIDPADNPATITTSVTTSGIVPSGLATSIVNGGAGTATRSATITPPAGGWRLGTYKFTITRGNGTCSGTQSYYIHISDGNRPNVTVPTTTVCYPGSGVVTATIPLPAAYKGVVNNSYFQDFDGRYRLTLVSKPAGAADPVFEPYNNTLFTNATTTISNLNMQGEYVFKIKADTYNPSVGTFLDKEYACAGTSLEGTFSVFVAAQVGANAGSAQALIGATQTSFNANNPGLATGAWTLLSKPAGATDPVIVTPSAYNTNVTGFNSQGTYTFRWTVTTGTCTSTSDLAVNVINATAGGVSGADFWVKSDDAGTIATAWKDQSANADNIPNIGGIILSPADRAHNFHPYTTGYSASKFFYNTNSVLNTTNNYLDPSMRSSVSVFSAVRPTSTNGTGRITGIDDDTNASEPGISINSGMPHIYKYFGNGGAQANSNTMSAANAFTTNKSSVFSAIQDQALNSGRGERRLGLDGIYEAFNLDSTTNTFNVLGKHLRIGYAGWDSPGAFPGDIMEVVWYKRALTPNEQSRVNSYLAVKNGTTLNENYLSTTNTVVWDRTDNIGYNNNIFGIAKDEFTALNQKQTGSVNDLQKLVISTTGFADSNAANSTDLPTDLQYLMTGDNGLEQKLKTPLVYTAGSNGEVSHRFESIWKVQNSGSVGTVTVAWPKGIKNLYLVQSPDAVFDGTDSFTPMATEITVNGLVYNTANVTFGNGQYFTFAGLLANYCVTGNCNPNTFLQTSDPNTIEYDNMVSTFHSSMLRDASTGALMVWGERMANNGSTSVLTPTEVNNTNYPALIGDILKFTSGTNSQATAQSVVLTTDGLFAWGLEGTLISSGLTSSTTFQKIGIGTYGVNGGAPKVDGLPDGVAPGDVKMMFGTYKALALTTCSGEAWVLAQSSNLYADGAPGTTANQQLWHRVHIDAATTLDDVVTIRGNGSQTLMALTATGEVYTWGNITWLGNGSAQAARTFATPITLPAGVTPKMIGATGSTNSTYYILGTNGSVYSTGTNNSRQLGNFSTINSNVWVQVQKSASAGDYLTNVVWISPNEHDYYGFGSINVLTADGRLWAWGSNDSQMLGETAATIDPTEMAGSIPATDPYDIGKLNWTDKVIAVETGGHTSMIVKNNSETYGYVGHRINGSMGDGTSTNTIENEYNFADTPEIDLCGAPVLPGFCYKPGITAGTALDTKAGITALSRAGTDNSDKWPMTRKGGWLALESKTKAFVPNRVAFDASGNPVGISAANFVEGMMVYDTVNKCMKIYTQKEGDTSKAWHCISTQTCPD
jgi:alpha-tubulin suppressor-like RCC1 family protein